MKHRRRNTFREYLLFSEIAALLAISTVLLISLWLVLDRANAVYLNLRLADAEKVHLFLESQLSEARKKIEVFTAFPERERTTSARHLFEDFSDIYLVDEDLRVARMYKSAPRSKVFEGFSFAGGRLGEYLRASNREQIFSDIMRGYEDDAPGIYYAHHHLGRLYLARMNLDAVRQFLVQFSRFSGTPLMFVSKDGFVMASSNPELNIYSLDVNTLEQTPTARHRLTAGNRTWIPVISAAGNIGAKVAIFIPTDFPDLLQRALVILYMFLISILLLLLILKNRLYDHFILRPLSRFTAAVEQVKHGSFALPDTDEDYRVHELLTLYAHFRSMAAALAQREHRLKQSEERARALAEQAEAASAAKSVFLANVSHHLRTPLNVILGFADLMTQDATLPTTYQEYLALIRQSGKDLLALINHMLTTSKLHSDQIVADKAPQQLLDLLQDPRPHATLTPQAEIVLEDSEIETLRRRMRDIPEEVRCRFIEATQQIDIVLMFQMIAQIRQTQPTVADTLERLTRNFDYERILNIVNLS